MEKLDITTMSDYKKVEAVIQLLIDGVLTSYRVATDANISKMSILTLVKGSSKIKNITYQTAIALINWYEENHEKYGITIQQAAKYYREKYQNIEFYECLLVGFFFEEKNDLSIIAVKTKISYNGNKGK